MVVTYVVSAVKLEILVDVFFLEGERNLTLENHIHFFEIVAFFYYDLVAHKEAAIQLGYKVRHKFFAANCIFKFKQMVKFLEELRDQLMNKPGPKRWLQLFKELKPCYQFFMVVTQALLDEFPDRKVNNLR